MQPSSFQSNDSVSLLRPESFMSGCFDDLFVFTKSKDTADHLEPLDAVLQRCQERDIYIKLAECTFCSHEVPCQGDYLGATVSAWIPIETSSPLIEATKGKPALERINLTLEQGKCFPKLKAHLTSPPVLAHPDSRRDFYVQMGASDYAVGGYLYQLDSEGKEKVIACSGKKLSSAELIEGVLELLAALHAMQVWRVYLIDKPFFVNTDHRPLQSILEQKTCSQRLARWLNELDLYQPRFRWILGNTNIVADAISRNGAFQPDASTHNVSLAGLLRQLTSNEEQRILSTLRTESTLNSGTMYSALQRGLTFRTAVLTAQANTGAPSLDIHRRIRANIDHFFLNDGILYFQPRRDSPRRICVPDDRDSKDIILYVHHNVASSGRPGCRKTLLALQEKFYWLHMERTVKPYVTTCEMCQRIKVSQRKPAALLHPLEIPDRRWSHIRMNVITGLPCSRHGGYDAVWVIVDRLT
ncbi:Retrotransposon protein, Ty3-gypsy subclass [Phytophthora megakarya]|uniref:Retrotransposon protein, Ty3-gypsy subclass n=1 Tax=Phytophthora megakarya TaxID=4795 RepID=A0A225UQT8_9STRA|nr:Retrotransposon protein, Ty3-gypsy subclass [Phytophthora megakarya]